MLSEFRLKSRLARTLVFATLSGLVIFASGHGCSKQERSVDQSQSSPESQKNLDVEIQNDRVLYKGEFIGVLPDSIPKNAQKTLEAALVYPKLPDGVLVPEITLLRDGRIWLSGGVGKNNTYSRQTWFFDPVTKKLNKGPDLAGESIKHQTLVLSDGRVLVTGGSTARPQEVGLVQILDPRKNVVSTVGNLVFPRYEHAMVELTPGVVAITGGGTRNGDQDEVELFDLKTNKSRMVGHLSTPRKQHQSLKLSTNQILVLQGRGFDYDKQELQPEVFVIPENK
ncbi:MAG: hypothetical protein KIT34_17300 [Cyanobacteria bacterium TGS_CYA1]|nr:hypothetical protein [Cyanobacteria bacterium TGS_CYA1]